MLVKDLMSKNLITSNIDESIHQIAQKMKKYDIGFMPITDDKKIIGILTDRDIVIEMISNYDHDITKYIKKNIIVIDEGRKVEEAIDIMRKKKVKRLIVVDRKKVVGIISISDALEIKEYEMQCLDALKCICKIVPIKKEVDTEIDEFYL